MRTYDIETGTLQDEIKEPVLDETQKSWYGMNTKGRYSDHVQSLLRNPRIPGSEETNLEMEDELIVPSEILVATTTAQEDINHITGRSRCGTSIGVICGVVAIPHRQNGYLGEAVPEVVHLSNFGPRKTPGPSEFEYRGHLSDGSH